MPYVDQCPTLVGDDLEPDHSLLGEASEENHEIANKSATGPAKPSATFTAKSATPLPLDRLRRLTENGPVPLRAFEDGDRARIADAFGITLDRSGLADCPLPGHDRTASLEVLSGRTRAAGIELQWCCNCLGSELHDGLRSDYVRHLADAFEAFTTGREIERGHTLPRGQRAYWRTRLAAAIGMIEIEPLPALPEDAEPLLHEARAHLALTMGRQRHATGSPVAVWTRGVLAADIGVTVSTARRLIEAMEATGVIERDHQDEPTARGRRGAIHWRPAAAVEAVA